MSVKEFAKIAVNYIHTYGDYTVEEREEKAVTTRSVAELFDILGDVEKFEAHFDVFKDESDYNGYEGTLIELWEYINSLTKVAVLEMLS